MPIGRDKAKFPHRQAANAGAQQPEDWIPALGDPRITVIPAQGDPRITVIPAKGPLHNRHSREGGNPGVGLHSQAIYPSPRHLLPQRALREGLPSRQSPWPCEWDGGGESRAHPELQRAAQLCYSARVESATVLIPIPFRQSRLGTQRVVSRHGVPTQIGRTRNRVCHLPARCATRQIRTAQNGTEWHSFQRKKRQAASAHSPGHPPHRVRPAAGWAKAGLRASGEGETAPAARRTRRR